MVTSLHSLIHLAFEKKMAKTFFESWVFSIK